MSAAATDPLAPLREAMSDEEAAAPTERPQRSLFSYQNQIDLLRAEFAQEEEARLAAERHRESLLILVEKRESELLRVVDLARRAWERLERGTSHAEAHQHLADLDVLEAALLASRQP